MNNFSDFLIYENGSFKTYSDIPYQGNTGNLVTFEAEDVYDMVNKIVLDVQDAIEDSYNTQVEVELTDLKNLTDALVAKVASNTDFDVLDVLEVANAAIILSGALIQVDQDDADMAKANIDAHRIELADIKSDIDSIETTFEGNVGGTVSVANFTALQTIRTAANAAAPIAEELVIPNNPRVALEAIATALNEISQDATITAGMLTNLGNFSDDVQDMLDGSNTFKTGIDTNLTTVMNALDDAESEANGIVTAISGQAGTNITPADYATFQATVLTPLATITTKAGDIAGVAINSQVAAAFTAIQTAGAAFATAQSDNQNIAVDDILVFIDKVLYSSRRNKGR